MPALKNPKHEAFARNVGILGMTAKDAYLAVWPASSQRTCEVEGSKLSLKPENVLRINELRNEAAARAAEKDFLTVEEKRAFLAKVVRTPLAEVTPKSELCQEWSETTTRDGGSEKIKMPSKLDAIKLDNELAPDAGSGGKFEIVIRKL
jgi:hypothetical protein